MTEEQAAVPTESSLEIVPRETWGALPARVEDLDASEFPLVIVNVTHHVGAPACASREECTRVMSDLQKEQIKDGTPDIHFNFIIGGDGSIFEGLGWHYKPWRYWFDDNRRQPAIDVGYLGDFRREPVPVPMFTSLSNLVVEGKRLGYIHRNFKYVRHLTPVLIFNKNFPYKRTSPA